MATIRHETNVVIDGIEYWFCPQCKLDFCLEHTLGTNYAFDRMSGILYFECPECTYQSKHKLRL